MSNPNHVTVRRTLLPGTKVPEALSDLDAALSTGLSCAEVQNDLLGKSAYDRLKAAVVKAHASQDAKQQLVLKPLAAVKTLNDDFTDVRACTRTYESAVGAIAKSNAQLINRAGLIARVVNPPPASLEKVGVVRCKPGKNPCEA